MKLNLFKKNDQGLPVYPQENLGENEDDGTIVDNVDKLAETVVGRRIVKAEKVTDYPDNIHSWSYQKEPLRLTLDNGHEVYLFNTDDCCAYTALQEFLLHPESVDHVILGVGTTDEYQTWHIYADFGDIMALEVGWSCGNPFYYGYGFDIQVNDIIEVESEEVQKMKALSPPSA